MPVAIDIWYHQNRKDAEGDFYRHVVLQDAGRDLQRTTQGFYICTPDGTLLTSDNDRRTLGVRRLISTALLKFREMETKPSRPGERKTRVDPKYDRKPPTGSAVARVFSRVVHGSWGEDADRLERLRRTATGRDHLWITRPEIDALAAGRLEKTLARRIARFHLIDNTRGEPPMWRPTEVERLELKLTPDAKAPEGAQRFRLNGIVHLRTANGMRGFETALAGVIETRQGKLTRCDLVARGGFWGHGEYTRGPPDGKFTLCVAFTLAPEGIAYKIPPQGSRSLSDYLKAN